MGEYTVLLGQRNDVPELMQVMDVLVLPSLFEGMPYVAVEAQASGLPVLLSETITKEACVTDRCFYLPLNDPQVWAEMIEKQFGTERKEGGLENTVYDLETEKREIMEVVSNGK
jgi:glycosyltransferase involved in cell wall biosynthesis